MKTANVLKALKVYGILPAHSSLRPLGSISKNHKVCLATDGAKISWWDKNGDVQGSLFLIINIKGSQSAQSASTIQGLLNLVLRKMKCFAHANNRYHVHLIPGRLGWRRVVLLQESYLDHKLIVTQLVNYTDNEAISLALCLFEGDCPFEVFWISVRIGRV